MKRTSLAILAFILAEALSLSQAWPAARLKFGTPSKTSADYVLPPLAAQDQNLWKEQGLEAEWIPFRGGAEMHRAFAAGAIDLALSSAGSTLRAISGGVPEIIVGDTKSRIKFVVWVKADGPIRKPEELKGKTIASGRMGELTHALGTVLAKALNLEGQIRFVSAGGVREEFAAIKAGALDGRVGGLLSGLPLKITGELREVVAVDDYLPSPWVDQITVAYTRVARDNPDLVKMGMRALKKAALFVMNNRDWAIAKMKQELGYPELAGQEIHNAISYGKDWSVDLQALENVRGLLIRHGVIPEKTPAPAQMYLPGLW